MIRNWIKRYVAKMSFVKKLRQQVNEYKANACYPPGHFYSPIISVNDIKAHEAEIWPQSLDQRIASIDLNVTAQKELLSQLVKLYPEIPFSDDAKEPNRYYYNNRFYSYTDGIVLYAMLRHYNPKKVIEIGSGFSSALMLDVNRQFFNNAMALTFIEPYPERLNSLLKPEDRQHTTIIQENVQQVDLNQFTSLEAGDILFIDSSHVVKTGSDVHYIIFHILPKLKSGVLIHFHDVFYPFEYPKAWVYGGRNWNETYFIRAFLMHNTHYKVILFSDYIHRFYPACFSDMPLTYKNTGGNLWLQKS
jgi:predicted O-methyltransferase YrrM